MIVKISKIIRATSFVLVFAISLASVAFATEGNSRQYYEYSVNARGETFGTSLACSNYAYNQSTVMSFSKDISHITISSDHYYSQGRVKLWNHEESEYEPYSMKRSPNV